VTDYQEQARREREASRARRRHFQEMDQRMRLDGERATRLLLDEFFPAGAPEGLLERLCLGQNRLVKEVVSLEKVVREMHDGINRIKNEADQRWMDGFNECARQVRVHADELGVSEPVVNSLLRGQVSMQEAEQAEKNRAASQQVEWSRT
jgi:hypothetical protein